MAGMADGMVEWRVLFMQTEWSNGGNGGRNGRMAGMADGMVEWQKWLHTYYLRYTHTDTDTDDDDDDDDNDTLIFYTT